MLSCFLLSSLSRGDELLDFDEEFAFLEDAIIAAVLFFFRSLSFCFPFVAADSCCARFSSSFVFCSPFVLGFSNFVSSLSMNSIHLFTPSRLTSLCKTVCTADSSFPMISCLTKSMDIFFGTPPLVPSNCLDASAVSKVVFPQPFLPMRPYLRPPASVREASVNKSGPPPFLFGKLKFVKCTSAALSAAFKISAISSPTSFVVDESPLPPMELSSSSIMRMASSIALFLSSLSIRSRISF
mmetsp:Transcript_10631/g.22941  ORF Transcript_10631/g.22941 Transcript_10631/m.22941 type:complete len:240 (+) Transcript_10631:1353-2072(+)